jgi:iron complex outermembrane receptor protein
MPRKHRRHDLVPTALAVLLSLGLAATAQEAPDTAGESNPPLEDLFDDELSAEDLDPDAQPVPEPEAEGELLDEPAGPDKPTSGIEEILVTARGNPQSLLDAPMSVTAFNAEYLEALGASDIRDLAQFTPNLEIKSSNAASNPKIFIRGVGLDDARANASSSVAVLVDDVYMNSPAGQLGQMFDLGSVEVLRGPQGIFYGRNATAGAIRLLSNKPSGEFGGALKVSYSEFDNGREGHELEGYLEAPLFGDILSGRLAGKLERREGYLLNRCGTPAGQSRRFNSVTKCLDFTTQDLPFEQPEKWLNDVDNWAGRALLRLLPPGTDSDWLLNFHGGQSDSLATQFQVIGTGGASPPFENVRGYIDSDNCTSFNMLPNGRVLGCNAAHRKPEQGDPYKGDYFRTGDEELDLFGSNLSGEWVFGDWTFDNITAYEWHDRTTFINTDGTPLVVLPHRGWLRPL